MNRHFSLLFTSNKLTLSSIHSKAYFEYHPEVICVVSIKFDPSKGPNVLINMSYENVPRWIREIPGHLKKQEMCEEAVGIEPRSLAFVPDRFKTEKEKDRFKICATRQWAGTYAH